MWKPGSELDVVSERQSGQLKLPGMGGWEEQILPESPVLNSRWNLMGQVGATEDS